MRQTPLAKPFPQSAATCAGKQSCALAPTTPAANSPPPSAYTSMEYPSLPGATKTVPQSPHSSAKHANPHFPRSHIPTTSWIHHPISAASPPRKGSPPPHSSDPPHSAAPPTIPNQCNTHSKECCDIPA